MCYNVVKERHACGECGNSNHNASEVEVSTVEKTLITYSQCGKNVLEKTLEDLEVDTENNMMTLQLTEAETNLFAPGKALIQVKAKVNGTSLASQMIGLPVKPVLDSKEI